MIDQSTRIAIFRLREQGHGSRSIARALGIARGTVKEVLRSATDEVPRVIRPEKGEPFRDEILELYPYCKGNLVRVHEELLARGADLSYQALTAFCRRHGIGHTPPLPAGHYDFPPGKEMQHDTSPHEARIRGKLRPVQTAALVLCYSRLQFHQHYPSFNRFTCRLFMTDALNYIGGAAAECMIDNTSVIVLRGTGKHMVPVAEMEAFGDRYGFTFKAHEVGDANRSARVEGPFDHIENNFLAGRDFEDFEHLNREAAIWCDKVNAKFSKKLHASRRELFAAEAPHLLPLPIWVPEVYQLHHRIVDIEGYVSVRGCRYSAPYQLIGRRLEVREAKDKVELFDGPRLVATHRREIDTPGARITLREHRPPRGELAPEKGPPREEKEILALAPELAGYVAELKKRSAGRGTLPLRKLLKMLRDYPRASFLEAVRAAAHYGLYDLERLERMILKNVARDFFPTITPDPSSGRQDPSDD